MIVMWGGCGGVVGMRWQLVVMKFGVLVWWWCSGDFVRCVGSVMAWGGYDGGDVVRGVCGVVVVM